MGRLAIPTTRYLIRRRGFSSGTSRGYLAGDKLLWLFFFYRRDGLPELARAKKIDKEILLVDFYGTQKGRGCIVIRAEFACKEEAEAAFEAVRETDFKYPQGVVRYFV